MVPELTPKARTTRFALAALVVFVLTAGIGGLFAPPLEGSGGCCAMPTCKYPDSEFICVNQEDCFGFECCFSDCY